MPSKLTRRDFLRVTALTGAAASAFSSSGQLLAGLMTSPSAHASEIPLRVVAGRCHECHVQCAMLVHVRDGRVVKVEGDPNGPNRGALCAKGQSTVKNLYSPERLNYAFKRTRPKGEADPGWVRISWEEALAMIAANVVTVRKKYGAHAIAVGQGTGRFTNEHNTRLKNSIGTPNLIGPCHICRGPMSATTLLTVGHHLHADYARTACQVYWGRNPAWSHAGVAGWIMDAIAERRAKLIVVDPRFEHPLAHKADLFLPVRPGSDGALMMSWIHVILSEGLYDKEFVKHWTNGPMLVRTDTMRLLREGEVIAGGDQKDFVPYPACVADRRKRPTFLVWDTVTNAPRAADSPGIEPALFGACTVAGITCKPVLQILSERAAEFPPERAAEICWTGSAQKIREAARLYARSASACTDVGSFGIQGIEGGHTNAFQTMRAQICLSAITGNINRPGGESGRPDWTWITGEWEREGGPRTMTPWGAPDDYLSVAMEGPHPAEPALKQYSLQPGMPSMLDAFRAMKTGSPYPIKTYIMVQGNPLGGWAEDQKTVYEGLKALKFLADMDLYITPTNNLADVVLPAALGPFERGKDKIIEPLFERWPDEKFYFQLGRRLDRRWWPWEEEKDWYVWQDQIRAENNRKAQAAGIAIERGEPSPPLDYYKTVDPSTGKAVGFPTPTGRIEIYSVIAEQHGFDPLPNYAEPAQSPLSPLARRFPLVLTTGARLPVFYHSQHRNNPVQRELFPHPQAEINPETAAKLGIRNGDWIWIESKTGKIRMMARLTNGILPGVVSMAHGWWQGCRELGLAGYGWEGANANLLVASDQHDPALGVPAARSQLCRVYKADKPPYVWEPPYYGTTQPKSYQGPALYPEKPPRKEV